MCRMKNAPFCMPRRRALCKREVLPVMSYSTNLTSLSMIAKTSTGNLLTENTEGRVRMLKAEIIAIGSEMLTPYRVDTNSLWLTERLNSIGIQVLLKTIVGDDEARLEEAVRDALKRSDIIISTGGLGPTEDDITRKVFARVAGRQLMMDYEI